MLPTFSVKTLMEQTISQAGEWAAIDTCTPHDFQQALTYLTAEGLGTDHVPASRTKLNLIIKATQ